MATELISTVLKAESEMRKTQNLAAENAKNIIKEAQEQASITRLSIIQQAQSTASLIVSEAEVAAEGMKKQAQRLADLREKKSITQTEKKYDEAIAKVIDFITE